MGKNLEAPVEIVNAGSVTPSGMRGWTARSVLALLDQGVISGSNLALNLLLARWLTPTAYGAFAVAFAGFLFLSGFHNALVLEPMSVLGAAKYPKRLAEYGTRLLKIHFGLTGSLGVLVLIGAGAWELRSPDHSLIQAFLGCALTMPLILFLWTERRFQYLLGRPAEALAGSVVYLLLAVGGITAIHKARWDNALTAFLVMGLASLSGAGFLLLRSGTVGTRADLSARLTTRSVLEENWGYGRWLVAVTFLNAFASQVQTFLVAGFVGLKGAAALRAVQLPMLAMTQALTAISTLALPVLSLELGRGDSQALHRKGRVITGTLTALAIGCQAILIAIPRPLEQLLYGGKFAAYAGLIPLLGLVPVFTAYAMGYSLILRAMQRPQHYLIVGAVTAVIGLVAGVWFTEKWGVAGAAASVVLAAAGSASVTVFLYRSWFPSHPAANMFCAEGVAPSSRDVEQRG